MQPERNASSQGKIIISHIYDNIFFPFLKREYNTLCMCIYYPHTHKYQRGDDTFLLSIKIEKKKII